MATIHVNESLEVRDKTISTFVAYEISARLGAMAVGEVLEVFTEDFDPLCADIEAWCRATGHRLRDTASTAAGRRFLIEKAAGMEQGSSLALVISSDGLEELLSPLGFALAAALEGMAVDIYVQGPAVKVLVEGFRPRLKGWARPFSRFAASGLAKAGHIAAQDKLRQLRTLGARIYACGPSMQHFKVDAEDVIFGDVPAIEYLSFMPVMEQADVQLYV